MKITPEANYISIRTNENVLPRVSPSNANLNARASQDTVSRMQRERAFIDALTIAQSSRDIIQKALTISSQLMGLVSDAMATGRINQDQLSSHIQSINSIIGNYGEIVSTPITNDVQPQVRNEQVRVNENFTQLRDMAVGIQSGRLPGPKDFEPVTKNLNAISSELDVKINNYLRDLGSTSRNNNFQELSRSTGAIILNNPVYALVAQGNINNEIAGKLTI
jgi:cytochrome c-type biogenesis protein CcmH/NrfF